MAAVCDLVPATAGGRGGEAECDLDPATAGGHGVEAINGAPSRDGAPQSPAMLTVTTARCKFVHLHIDS